MTGPNARFLLRVLVGLAAERLCERIKPTKTLIQLPLDGETLALLRAAARRQGTSLEQIIDEAVRVGIIRAEREMKRRR